MRFASVNIFVGFRLIRDIQFIANAFSSAFLLSFGGESCGVAGIGVFWVVSMAYIYVGGVFAYGFTIVAALLHGSNVSTVQLTLQFN